MSKRPIKTDPSPCDPPDSVTLTTHAAIVDHYIANKRPIVEREREFFRGLSLPQAIHYAAMAKRRDGKRQDHQRRLKGEVLEECERRLQGNREKLRRLRSFSELHDFIAAEVGALNGVGPLTVYDIAYHIGAKTGVEPEAVYLHAGTRSGAKQLGLGRGCKTLLPEELKKPYRRLKPREIEDCLCSYADFISAVVE